MAFAGLKKQINKANQYVSEKIGGAEGTKFTEDFCEMERRTDLTNELVEDLIVKTKEYLQPNPATRAKLMMSTKLRGGPKQHAYLQPEGILGESMVKFGKDLGEDSSFSNSLMESGEALKQMAEVKYALEDNVKQNFLEPLHHLQTKELKDVLHHRKKLQGRRLDYDCKKRKQARGHTQDQTLKVNARGAHVTDDEIKLAEDKFEESFNLASMGMHNLLENEVEQISQLTAFIEGLTEYHQQCAEILQALQERLVEQKNEAAERPREPYQPKTLNELNIPSMIHDDVSPGMESGAKFNGSHSSLQTVSPARSPATSPMNPRPSFLGTNFNNSNQGSPARSPNASPLPSPVRSPARTPMRQQPCCQALYDFDPENEGELGFKESDVINLTKRIDDNWFEGNLHGRSGLFPISYVQVLVPLP